MGPFIFFAFLFFPIFSFSADFYQGIRQMGMGGAAISVVNDETALLLNPNGLVKLRGQYWTLIDPELTTNKGSVKTVQDLAVVDGADPEKIYQELGGQQGETYYFKGQIFPSFAMRNFGLGVLGRSEVLATRLVANDFLRLNYISDWAVVGGYNYNFWSGILKVGANFKLIDRVSYSGDIDPNVQGLNVKNFAAGGVGLGSDVAISLTSPTSLLPTLTVIAKDIGDTSFGLSKSTRNYSETVLPQKIPMAMDVAVALFPIHSNSHRSTFTVEYDDVLEDGDAERKLHLGYELNLADRFFIRAGYNKGYMTAGFEWATAYFQWQLAYYGEEIGTDATPLKDERLATKFLLRF